MAGAPKYTGPRIYYSWVNRNTFDFSGDRLTPAVFEFTKQTKVSGMSDEEIKKQEVANLTSLEGAGIYVADDIFSSAFYAEKTRDNGGDPVLLEIMVPEGTADRDKPTIDPILSHDGWSVIRPSGGSDGLFNPN